MLVVCKNAIKVIGNAETDTYIQCVTTRMEIKALSQIHTCQPPVVLH